MALSSSYNHCLFSYVDMAFVNKLCGRLWHTLWFTDHWNKLVTHIWRTTMCSWGNLFYECMYTPTILQHVWGTNGNLFSVDFIHGMVMHCYVPLYCIYTGGCWIVLWCIQMSVWDVWYLKTEGEVLLCYQCQSQLHMMVFLLICMKW